MIYLCPAPEEPIDQGDLLTVGGMNEGLGRVAHGDLLRTCTASPKRARMGSGNLPEGGHAVRLPGSCPRRVRPRRRACAGG